MIAIFSQIDDPKLKAQKQNPSAKIDEIKTNGVFSLSIEKPSNSTLKKSNQTRKLSTG